tara:strand:+ start:797 stop:1426 length:630 start_codon:yes stop_codon:yes gene_type:complete
MWSAETMVSKIQSNCRYRAVPLKIPLRNVAFIKYLIQKASVQGFKMNLETGNVMNQNEETRPFVVAGTTAPGDRRYLRVVTQFAVWFSGYLTVNFWENVNPNTINWRTVFLEQVALEHLMTRANLGLPQQEHFHFINPVIIPATNEQHIELKRLADYFRACIDTGAVYTHPGYEEKIYQILCHVLPLDYACSPKFHVDLTFPNEEIGIE